ncbi:MAG: UDP-N-acetylmuramate dehydrogenase [Candidatus Gracilibacteria bacterium]|nr:UDP-N-acetylmuramate dehydrogenase [Candidatus Gracilibacteria bacterium]
MLQYLEQNKDITNFSGYRTKAIARYFFELKSIEDIIKIKEIQDFAKGQGLKIEYIGGGMNIFFDFDVFEGIIIKNNLKGFEIKDKILDVNSGESVTFLVSKLERDFGNLNLKPWCSLPGTVGGAIIGNAGCFGLEVKDIFISADIYDLSENRIFEAGADFMKFEYRNTFLKKNKRYFIISSKLDISKTIDNFYSDDFRFKNQPKGFNCGSVFKNPEGLFAGKLIEDLGLKGKKIGGAEISPVHANFIVSDGTATHNDIKELLEFVKGAVFNEYGVNLEPEINIIF